MVKRELRQHRGGGVTNLELNEFWLKTRQKKQINKKCRVTDGHHSVIAVLLSSRLLFKVI